MKASDHLVNTLMHILGEHLSPLGFKSKGHTFVRRVAGAQQFINIQKGTSSTSDVAVVTFNVGTVVDEIRDSIGRHRPTRYISDCDWQQRIGTYIGGDKWWSLNNMDEAASVANEVLEILRQTVIADVDRMSDVDGLRSAISSRPLINFSVEVLDYFNVRPGG